MRFAVKPGLAHVGAVICLTLLMAAGLCNAGYAATDGRIALVIGNAAYDNAGPLSQPANDAREVAHRLERLGFDVDLQLDLRQDALRAAVRKFGLGAEQANIALVFFSGLALQVDARTYLLAVDARLRREVDLLYEGLPLELVVGEVEQAKTLGLIILDASRDSPLAGALAGSLSNGAERVKAGIAPLGELPANILVAVAAEPGQLSVESEARNSPYSVALLKHLRTPGLGLEAFFERVRDSVSAATNGRQRPRVFASFGDAPVYLNPEAANKVPFVGTPSPLTIADDAEPSVFRILGPIDPDNDPVLVTVTEVPRSGAVLIGEKPVREGDILTAEELQLAAYKPNPGDSGEVGAFAFVVEDDRGGTASGQIPVTVIPSNRAPVASGQIALQIGDIPLNLEEPMDPDGDPLEVKVTKLPSNGAIRLGSRSLSLGETVTPADVPALVYRPGAGFTGDAGSFELLITDPGGASTVSSIRILLPGYGAEAAAGEGQAATPPAAAPEGAQPQTPAPETAEVAPQTDEPSQGIDELSGAYRLRTDSNLRAGPTTQAARITVLERGSRVTATGRVTGTNWYEVLTPDGQSGFIFGDLIEPISVAEVQQAAAAAEPKAASLETAPQLAAGLYEAEGDFKDCEVCPLLVQIPPGSFEMGSDSGYSSERPRHRVSLPRAFAIGKYEVTHAQWNACVAEAGCRYRPDAGAPNNLPVFNISWNDAQDYLKWLTAKTGKAYRLATEAEWEYVAGAGTRDRYWWGSEVDDNRANCKGCGGSWNKERPSVVGSYAPNPFGVHDMNGGVAEWVADCWNKNYKGAPSDGSAWSKGDCGRRVLRGGSWRNDPSYLTTTSRLFYDADVRYIVNGLRVARALQ